MNTRQSEGGVVLVNVLVVLAIAGGLMVLLISSQEAALDRVARSSDAAIVRQIALGAEASVVDALRRDLDVAPEKDHLNEAWALGVIQQEVVLPTGRFSVGITDLQAKFDVNLLADLTAGTQDFARRLMTALDQPPAIANQIARILGAVGPVARLEELETYGVAPEAIAALAPYVTVLPVSGTINLNSVDPFLLNVMLQNRSQTAQLVRTRESRGSLSLEALTAIGALRPQNSGFTSNAYLADILATAGNARIRMQSVIIRRNARGVKAVEVAQRRFIYDAPTP
ncbi:type II secretion system protein GspK [Sulfitobacter sp. F26204]|uniref:general secretion pathway protein GspK n=1 Tax=Sulfitobacter sp. F26204 TaxID=2996014 RepID=UPI00225E4217|nr:type II secretion system protein GspK [Sulfitobacter sp. F26204]MCX7560520.1 type II secretion system protein GspK [Sulfitobacter sp. F26204]